MTLPSRSHLRVSPCPRISSFLADLNAVRRRGGVVLWKLTVHSSANDAIRFRCVRETESKEEDCKRVPATFSVGRNARGSYGCLLITSFENEMMHLDHTAASSQQCHGAERGWMTSPTIDHGEYISGRAPANAFSITQQRG